MYWSEELTDCSALFRTTCDNRLGNRRKAVDNTRVQNLLNGDVISVINNTTASAAGMAGVKKYGSSSNGSFTGSLSAAASNGNRLPVKCDRYKTELCRTFDENGTCRYGDKCQFAHGLAELRTVARHPKYKTDLCRTFHTTGFCPYGSRCHFIHSLHERQVAVQPIDPSHLLLSLLAVKSTQLQSGRLGAQQQSPDNLLQTLSSLLRTDQSGADQVAIAAGLLAREQSRKLGAAGQTAASEFLLSPNRIALQRRLPRVHDSSSVSTGSAASPCPSPTSPSGVYDDLLSPAGSYFAVSCPQDARFQSPTSVPVGILSPPGSPGSAASSLNSSASDLDGYDAAWSRSVWPALQSPVKSVDVSLFPDFAHPQLLNNKH